MKSVLRTPQAFFIFLAILIMIIGFYKDGAQLDLNYFLAFLLIDVWSVSLISALFFILISINYASLSLIGKKPVKTLTLIHIILQVAALIPLVYFMTKSTNGSQQEGVATSNVILLLSFVVFIISVVIHLINFFYTILKKE